MSDTEPQVDPPATGAEPSELAEVETVAKDVEGGDTSTGEETAAVDAVETVAKDKSLNMSSVEAALKDIPTATGDSEDPPAPTEPESTPDEGESSEPPPTNDDE